MATHRICIDLVTPQPLTFREKENLAKRVADAVNHNLNDEYSAVRSVMYDHRASA